MGISSFSHKSPHGSHFLGELSAPCIKFLERNTGGFKLATPVVQEKPCLSGVQFTCHVALTQEASVIRGQWGLTMLVLFHSYMQKVNSA